MGDESSIPSEIQRQSPGRESGGRSPPEAEAKCQLPQT